MVWARSVFSAPRRLDALVTAVESRDEVIERVATHVIRRDLREVRAATSERRSTRPRVEPSSVDPFAHTSETLKADSEYVAQCEGCGASGRVACRPCHGTGNGRCPSCSGSGKERSAKTGRPIKCKSCKATGVAPCRNCGGQGSVHCHACLGSGHQLAWLAFQQAERWDIAVPATSPIIVAHPALRQDRPMKPDDLAALSVLVERHQDGPLQLQELVGTDRQTVRRQLECLDPRLERVQFQQYLRLAVLRRDVTFEMCGAKATLSLTGTTLIGATTPEVLRPIRRRLYAWIALCGVVGLLGLLLRGAVIGSSGYFRSANEAAGLLVAAAVVCAIPAFGALLRSWRGGLRFHPIRRRTTLWSASIGVAFVSIAVLGLVASPDAAEAERLLAANDLPGARETVSALVEQRGATSETQALEDRVILAEAGRLSGEARLKLLDAVAARKGAAAAGAASDARVQRLAYARQLIATQHQVDALAFLDRDFAGDTSVPVAEERARAHEAALAACRSIACELGAATRARDARITPERVAALEAVRAHAVAALAPEQIMSTQVLPRLQQLRRLRDTATAVAQAVAGDLELQARAGQAIQLAEAGRAAVPLLGNELPVVEELLGSSTVGQGHVPSIALDRLSVSLSLDGKGRCAGVYAVGDKAGEREIQSGTWPPARLLSQAVGRKSTLQAPSGAEGTTRWYAGGTPVVARWLSGALIELRIGDATP